MRFYNASRFIFPRSYEHRIMLVCFGAVHIPLIAYSAVMAARGDWDWSVFYLLLIATLVGTVSGILALAALLKPIRVAITMLDEVHSGGGVAHFPPHGDDLVGRLFKGVLIASERTAQRVSALSHAAMSDPLTGLKNRRGFLESAVATLDDAHNSVIALVDIDHFKKINDVHGHEAGDMILAAFARDLDASVRRSDLTARWGGEEFAILLPNAALDEARNVIMRLRTRVAEAHAQDGAAPAYTFSCGLAVVRGYDDLANATRRADQALYAAKSGGRDRVESAD
jgi:diguanylate cyclase